MQQGPGEKRPKLLTKKIIHFEFSMKHKIRILITEPELTIGWLYCECTRKLMEYIKTHPKIKLNFDIQDFMMLRTKQRIYNLDYYLTLQNQPVSTLNDGIVLVPYISKKILKQDTSTLRNYKFLAKLGEGGFSSVYLVRKLDDGFIYSMKIVDRNLLPNSKMESL